MTEPKNKKNLESSLVGLFSELIETLGGDKLGDGVKNTPKRAAKAYNFLLQGYDLNAHEIIKGALFDCDNNDMVVVRGIELFSICEHHLLPIIGRCHVAYIPNRKIIGLSKIARVVDVYARRLQVQERMTNDIAKAIMEASMALGVCVVVEAEHLCMMARGVEKQHTLVKTISKHGVFKEDKDICNEFFNSLDIGFSSIFKKNG